MKVPPHVPAIQLRASAGATMLTWGVDVHGPTTSLRFSGMGVWSKLHKNAAAATEWADAFIAGKKRLGYRASGAVGTLDVETVLAATPCADVSDDRTAARVQHITWFDHVVYELEALSALLVACPSLARLAVRNRSSGEQSFDPQADLVLAQRPPLTRLALFHSSYAEPGDHISSAYTSVSKVEPLLDALPALRELVLHVTFIRADAFRHPRLTKLSIRTGQFGHALGTAMRTAELPALTSLRIDLLDDQNFTEQFPTPWERMFKGQFPALRRLAVVNTDLGTAVVADLLSGTVPPLLEHLDLTRSHLDARGVEHLLAEHRRFAHVRRLTLDENPLDDAALAELRRVYGDRVRHVMTPLRDVDD